MDNRIRHILNQINSLEEELRAELHEHESRLLYQIKGSRVEFEHSVREAHNRLKMGVFRWFLTVRPQQFLTAPIIYGMIVPLAFLDLCVTLYQATCFPLYGIAKARRTNYIVFDHQHLAYLNVIEKFHCLYCSYASGLIAYVGEITARTEQFFCPIKHAHKVLGSHARYARFLDYGDAADFHAKLEELRAALAENEENSPSSPPA
jgi:hypothetical protein